MKRMSLVVMTLAVAAMLALPACSNRKGSMLDPASTNSGGNNSGGANTGGNNTGGNGY